MLNVNKIKKDLKIKGFCHIKKFLCKNKNFKKHQLEVVNFLNFYFKKRLKKIEDFDQIIFSKFKKNKKISGSLNDKINLLPSLHNLLNDDIQLGIIKKILSKNNPLICNNHRLRLQIPGNDRLANLPWHFDEQYNKFKNVNSIVVWISLVDITYEMGPLVFKESSHKIKNVKFKRFKKSSSAIVPSVVISPILKKKRETSFETKKGDIILIDFKTIHKSGINLASHKVKWSAQARFHSINR